MNSLKYILFVFIIVGMLVPGFQKAFHYFEVKPLHGDFKLSQKPEISTSSWLAGSFQTQYDAFLEQHIGFRSFLVRLNNQIDYSFYRKANAEGVVIGKEDFLYEYDYIRAFTGIDFVGGKYINEKLNRLKFIQEYLKDSLDIDLVLVFEPGKASFYPEYIPDSYLEERSPGTNYSTYLKTAQHLNIKHIDLNNYFLNLNATSIYPMFPKYGTHWSIYGMSFAADTLLKTVEQTRKIELRTVTHDSIFVSTVPLKTDDDVEKPMNLLFSLPAVDLAYPVFEFDEDSIKDQPMVLAVADSYYWNIFNTRIPQRVFANEAFWYFNARVYPDFYDSPTFVKDLDLKTEIEKQDVIFLMVTERFLYKFDWGFVDDVYKLYTPSELQLPVYNELNRILKDEVWFTAMIQSARERKRNLDSTLWMEARYQFRKKDKLAYLAEFGVKYYEEVINQDSTWRAGIVAKAKRKAISYEEMLQLDANYVFKKEYPDLYNKRRSIQQVKKQIRGDSLMLKEAKKLADFYHCSLERAIDYQAKKRIPL